LSTFLCLPEHPFNFFPSRSGHRPMVSCLSRAARLEYGRILQRNDRSAILLTPGQDSMGCVFLLNSTDGTLHHFTSTVRSVKYSCIGASSARPEVVDQKTRGTRRNGDRV